MHRSDLDFRTEVARLDEALIDEAGSLLAQCFFRDPLVEYTLPNEAERARPLHWNMSTAVRYGYYFGQVWQASTGTQAEADLDGVAIWLRMGEPVDNLDRMERSGMVHAPEILGGDAFSRYVGVLSYLESLRRQQMPEPHWYLWQVGVAEARRGRGLGAALLRPMLVEAVEQELPCYLETFRDTNLSFYHRLGFATLMHDVEPGSGLTFWTLRRDPRPFSTVS
jgi:ribosomal protein S18 acetylase RimI-like enzyme